MIYVFLGVILLIAIIIIPISIEESKTIRERINEEAKTFKKFLQENDFVISKIVESGQCIICVDEKNKKFAINSDNCKIYNFNELIDFEIFEDGNSIISR